MAQGRRPAACHMTLQQDLRLLELSKVMGPAAGRPEVSFPEAAFPGAEAPGRLTVQMVGQVLYSGCKWPPCSESRELHLGPIQGLCPGTEGSMVFFFVAAQHSLLLLENPLPCSSTLLVSGIHLKSDLLPTCLRDALA